MARDAFASIMSSLDNPLIVVTTAEGDERAGCLVGFHAQSSIDPDRYCVWLSKANHTYRVGLRATHLAVHFLTAGDLALAQRFGTLTGDETDKFAGLRVGPGPGGVPVLEDCPHRLILRRVVLLDEGGDHVCVTSEPLAAESSGAFEPLRLSQAGHLEPGHGARERPGPPTERAAPRGPGREHLGPGRDQLDVDDLGPGDGLVPPGREGGAARVARVGVQRGRGRELQQLDLGRLPVGAAARVAGHPASPGAQHPASPGAQHPASPGAQHHPAPVVGDEAQNPVLVRGEGRLRAGVRPEQDT
jgi:flavin reductase (DIM6/NTAB) family NADH-FMN oxidoreductase RutF